jgi:transporter family protein
LKLDLRFRVDNLALHGLLPPLRMSWLAWAFLSALFAGLTAILAKVGVAEVNSNLATAVRTVVILVFSLILSLGPLGRGELGRISGKSWFFLAASGVATGLSWLCYFRALQLGPASKVAPIDKLSVVVAIVLAVLFLGERLNLREFAGAGLIVFGAVLLVLK